MGLVEGEDKQVILIDSTGLLFRLVFLALEKIGLEKNKTGKLIFGRESHELEDVVECLLLAREGQRLVDLELADVVRAGGCLLRWARC